MNAKEFVMSMAAGVLKESNEPPQPDYKDKYEVTVYNFDTDDGSEGDLVQLEVWRESGNLQIVAAKVFIEAQYFPVETAEFKADIDSKYFDYLDKYYTEYTDWIDSI